MICSIVIGRKGSKGFPGKNNTKILGKSLFEYPILASLKSKNVDKVFLATDCPVIIKKSIKYKKKGLNYISRPRELNNDKAIGDDVFKFCYDKIKNDYAKSIEFIILLFANAPTINAKMIDEGVDFLRKNKSFDSIVSVSKYNMWSPLRARKLNNKGELVPFVPFRHFSKDKNLNCDRDSQGNVYFADMSLSVVRPKCLENMKNNLLPQRWMGKKIAPIFSQAGFDIDYSWQLPGLKYWIKNYGK